MTKIILYIRLCVEKMSILFCKPHLKSQRGLCNSFTQLQAWKQLQELQAIISTCMYFYPQACFYTYIQKILSGNDSKFEYLQNAIS